MFEHTHTGNVYEEFSVYMCNEFYVLRVCVCECVQGVNEKEVLCFVSAVELNA